MMEKCLWRTMGVSMFRCKRFFLHFLVYIPGNVRVVQAGLHIGDGSGLANFKGYIDEVSETYKT